MSVVECEVCRAKSSPFLEYRGVNLDKEVELQLFAEKVVYRCSECDHVFCYPGIESKLLKQYYEAEYCSPKTKSGLKSILRRYLSPIKSRINPSFSPAVITQFECVNQFLDWQNHGGDNTERFALEVGAAQAEFSRYLIRNYQHCYDLQLNVHVVEPRNQYDQAYKMFSIKKVADTIENVDDCYSYNLIHVSHCLEHLNDLHLAVRKFKKYLADNGILFIEVPNCEDLYWKYRFFPNPPHLHFFNPKSLRYLFEAHDFNVLFLKTCGGLLEIEKDIGFLEEDTPLCIGNSEVEQLYRLRDCKFQQVLKNKGISSREYSLSNYRECSESGRSYIYLVATPFDSQ